MAKKIQNWVTVSSMHALGLRTTFLLQLLVSAAVLFTNESLMGMHAYDLRVPSLSITTLDEQFPKDPPLEIAKLQLYKQDLEFFRKQILEGYNRALIIHAAEVDQTSKQLESDNARGQVPPEDYQRIHGYLVEELLKLHPNGDYMLTYRDYLGKYRSRVKWANEQISVITARENHNKFEM